MKRLNDATKSAESAGSSVDYSSAVASIEQRLEEAKTLEEKVREVCLKREKRWRLSIQLDQLGPDIDKVQPLRAFYIPSNGGHVDRAA